MHSRLRLLALLVAALFTSGACAQLGLSGDDTDETGAKKKDKKKGKKKKQKKSDDADDSSDEAAGSDKSEKGDGSVPAPKPGEVPQLRVGAFSKYKVTGKMSGEAYYAALAKRGADEYQIEARVDASAMPVQIQAWVKVPDLMKPAGMKLLELKARAGGRELPSGSLGLAKPMFDKLMFAHVPPKFDDLPQEAVEVPAGKFEGCYRWSREEEAFGIKAKSTMWTHPAVPLPAFVRLETEGSKYELVEYAYEGAKSSF